jgi:hypothetical protein
VHERRRELGFEMLPRLKGEGKIKGTAESQRTSQVACEKRIDWNEQRLGIDTVAPRRSVPPRERVLRQLPLAYRQRRNTEAPLICGP